jgi:hypothetical protein
MFLYTSGEKYGCSEITNAHILLDRQARLPMNISKTAGLAGKDRFLGHLGNVT